VTDANNLGDLTLRDPGPDDFGFDLITFHDSIITHERAGVNILTNRPSYVKMLTSDGTVH